MPKALICGISGQDGSYLAKLLLSQGYEVFGTSRDAMASSFNGLNKLGIFHQVNKLSMAINDFRSVFNVIQQCEPDEIYNLAGQTSVALSFQQPVEAMESIAGGTLNLLEVIRLLNSNIKLYNAGSSECFGETPLPATEESPFKPRSPYATAKSSAHWLIRSYRDAYGLFACTGILFNHESPLRPERFVTQKIVASAARIFNGSEEVLQLGNLEIYRDWGWAPDYVEAMSLMLKRDQPEDFLISTGESHSLVEFVDKSFAYFGLDWRKHVVFSEQHKRPTDIYRSLGNPVKANLKLQWFARHKFFDVIRLMCESAKKANIN